MLKVELRDKDIDITIPFRIERIICDMWCGVYFVNNKNEAIVAEPDYVEMEYVDGGYVIKEHTLLNMCKKDSDFLGKMWEEGKIDDENMYEYDSEVEGDKAYNFTFEDFWSYVPLHQLNLIAIHKNYNTVITFESDNKNYKYVGKIEDIKDLVYFEGKTIEEADKKFEEAVDHYLEVLKNEV